MLSIHHLSAPCVDLIYEPHQMLLLFFFFFLFISLLILPLVLVPYSRVLDSRIVLQHRLNYKTRIDFLAAQLLIHIHLTLL